MLLFREMDSCGLGMFNVKVGGTATLIHTFFVQAVSPLFPTNYHLNWQSSSCVFCDAEEHLFSCSQSREVTKPLLACMTSQLEGPYWRWRLLNPGNSLLPGSCPHVWCSSGSTEWLAGWPAWNYVEQNWNLIWTFWRAPNGDISHFTTVHCC